MVQERTLWLVVLAACIFSRLLSAIYYIEDPDSLRFAMSMVDYDVTKLQPHFPAYPVFCFATKILYWLTGRYAVAFALLGAWATFALIFFSLRIAGLGLDQRLGALLAFVLFFNPLLWLMGNRYMPDLAGVTCLAAALYCLGFPGRRLLLAGFFLSGVLAGIRLSYMPFALMPLALALVRPGPRLGAVGAGVFGVGIWLLPLGFLSGWENLWTAAQVQSQGHFGDFGGTVSTEPDMGQRLLRLVQSLWSDGLGLYWYGRHWLSAGATLALAVMLLGGWRHRAERLAWHPAFLAVFLGAAIYLGWIFFFQNVVYKSRHVLPLIPLGAFAVAALMHQAWRVGICAKAAVMLFACCYVCIGGYLAWQHTQPTAIAQMGIHLRQLSQLSQLHPLSAEDKMEDRQMGNRQIAAVPLIVYFLRSQAIPADYLVVASASDLDSLAAATARERRDKTGALFPRRRYIVGNPLPGLKPLKVTTFYHNPYVNRMWPQLSLYEY
jgi:hypothetical protein